MKRLIPFLLFLSFCMIVQTSAQKLPLVYSVENTSAGYPDPSYPAFDQLPTITNLPDPFMWADGRGRIANISDWKYRRAEIKSQIEHYEIGEKPDRPDSISASFSGNTLTVIVTVNGQKLTLTSQIVLPTGTGTFPAVIGMNSPSGSVPSSIFTSRNIAQITYSHNQVTTYSAPKNTDPYYKLYPRLNITNTGQYSAWAWGVSRIIDGLELVQNVLPIDLKHIAVTGCSYAGKMAIFSGAFDERVALTIGQESGGGGYTTWRVSELKNGDVETLEATDYNWFMDSMKALFGGHVNKLPEDHHELMAMVAPRALLVTGNPSQIWLSDESGYVGSKAAKEVWAALGVPERFAYSIITDHPHCAVPASQVPEIEAMVDKYLMGKDTTFTLATATYTTDLTPWITWTTPMLTNGTSSMNWTSLRYPADLQTDLDTSVTFKWNKVQDAQKYVLQVSTDPSFTTLDKADSTTTDTLKTISGLAKGRTYYWRVRVTSTAALNLWSNVWSFNTTTPLPAKPQPASAFSTYPDRADYVSYTWQKVQYANSYLVQVAKDPSFATLFKTGTTTDTVKSISGHSNGATYYWRVQATSFAGIGPWSDVKTYVNNVTAVKEEEGLPTKYSLGQNYPNPFNPSTKITFALPQRAMTKLTIYDLLGREVQTLLNAEMEAGYHEVNFDASALTNGVYLCKMQAGTFTDSIKLLLTK